MTVGNKNNLIDGQDTIANHHTGTPIGITVQPQDFERGKHKKVYPIKDKQVLHDVLDTLKHNFKYGVRDYTIFRVGIVTMLRVSDLMALRLNEVFNEAGEVRSRIDVTDIKTGKRHKVFLDPVKNDLREYLLWLKEHEIESDYLFPAISPHSAYNPSGSRYQRPLSTKAYYRTIMKVEDLLGIDYLGTHSMRKTGAYMVYEQTHHNIGLVMTLLNHSSESSTLHYLGLDEETKEKALRGIDFG